jgi:hypothetical protein
MTLKTRQIIAYTFIISFLIAAPILVLYGNGYRFDIKNWKIQKTGIIFLTSNQADVSVYLNDKLYGEKINNKNLSVKNFLPGDYIVRAEKDGYTAWQKKLTVASGKAVFTDEILLMKKSIPFNIVSGKIQWVNFSNNQKMAVYFIRNASSNEIWLYNLANKQSTLLYKISSINSSTEAAISWSHNDAKILLNIKNGNKNNYSIININKPDQIVSLADLSQKSFSKLKWSDDSDNIIYGILGNKLNKISLEDQKPNLLLNLEIGPKDTLDDYLIDSENVYYIRTDKNNSFVIEQKLNDPSGNAWMIKLPRSENCSFVRGNNQYLSILSTKDENLFLFKKDFFQNIALTPENNNSIIKLKARGASWQPQSNRLLFYNDFEIWVDDLDNDDQKLIARYSEKIGEVIWHPDYAYIIGLIGQDVKIFEINGTERNINSLINLKIIQNLKIDPLGEKLYFISEIGHQEGLYAMDVK